MNTKIFVITHKKFDPPMNPIYTPLHVGRINGPDLGYIGDDTGDNISSLNQKFVELTGMYWVWKNYDGPEDYIGINHYRRYFFDEAGGFLSDDEITDIMGEYDMIASERIDSDENYYESYAKAHNIRDLEAVGRSIERLYPNYKKDFEKALSMHALYSGNLLIMRRKDFDAYCKWLFDILFDASEEIDASGYNLYEVKAQGFLAEGLLYVWTIYNKKKVYEARIGYTEEKAETKELKLAVGQLISMGQYEEAEKLFNDVMTLRPDISLPMSDVHGEIPVIQQILYIGNQERLRGLTGIFAQSDVLKELIAVYDDYYKSLHRIGEERVSSSEIDERKNHLVECGFTDVTLEVMLHYDMCDRYGFLPLNEAVIRNALTKR